MAELCPGVQYGLSSQESFGENKDLIFVKLTDSAYRAIEEYLKNRNKFSCQSPTIKFLGNGGNLAFPIPQNGKIASFNFSLSSTQDIEGPGGSFECIQQSGHHRGSLEVLGSIPHKMRIHANDDIYAATKQRMTVAEENHKNKCTREIKPNQTDIGRKVKVKQNHRIPPLPPQKNPPPSMRDSLLKPSYQSSVPSKPVVNSTNGLGSNHVSSSRPHQNKPSTPDIAKRPIKERLIHLLALRPFKKVELMDRLTREGLREKNSMSSVLKQIAHIKDNAFHLHRSMWNDVHEDWPFYTESEKQILKRRKPQNQTPPGSSDSGSSASGQSPSSSHPGSPPPITTTKRPGYYDGADGFPTKRPRVSHYRKPSEIPNNLPPAENQNQRKPITDSRDTSNMNPRSRESTPTNGHYVNGFVNGNVNEKKSYSASPNDLDEINSRKRISTGESRRPVADPEIVRNDIVSSRKVGKYTSDSQKDLKYTNRDHNYKEKWTNNSIEEKHVDDPWDNPNGKIIKEEPWLVNGDIKSNGNHDQVVSSSMNGKPQVSPDSQSDLIATVPDSKPKVKSISPPFPDYVTEYTPITSYEQRKRYKSDFNDNYAEYKDLHGVVEKVSRRFAELEERLKQEDTRSPRYKDIKKQILTEYKENKKNVEHQKAKLRFQYLHEKLSHIKALVKDYDKTMSINQQYNQINKRY